MVTICRVNYLFGIKLYGSLCKTHSIDILLYTIYTVLFFVRHKQAQEGKLNCILNNLQNLFE